MISKRASKFTSFIVMDVMAKAEELERKGENGYRRFVQKQNPLYPRFGAAGVKAVHLRFLFKGIRRYYYARSGDDLHRYISGSAFRDAGHFRSRR